MADLTFFGVIGEFAKPIAIGLAAYGGAAISSWYRGRKEKKTHKPIQSIYREDLEISLILDRALFRLGAMRVYLSQFHNGDAYLGGPDIIRKSRTHERVRVGLSYQQEQYKGILMSGLAEEAALVVEEGASWTPTRDIPTSKFRWLLDTAGVKAVARCAIVMRGRIVGFVGADFDTEDKPQGMETLCSDAAHIANILLAGQK